MTRDVGALAAGIVLAALCAAAVGPAYVNHDAAWYLHMAGRWIDGAALYRDVIDTNPPLIVWLTWLPVRIAGASAPAAFKLFVFLIAAASIAACRQAIRRQWPGGEFAAVTTIVFLCLPFAKGDFGQREHLAVLLTLPYVLAAAFPAATSSPAVQWATGVAGGLGFVMKPHFVLAWAAVELIALRLQGRAAMRRHQLAGAAIAAVAYTVAVVATAPDYLTVINQVRAVYGGLDADVAVLLRLREVQLWLAAAALFAAVRWPAGTGLPPVLFAAATGYLAAAMLQQKGWGYHLYPARVFTLLFLLTAIVVILEAVPAVTALLRGGRRGLAAVLTGVLVVASARYIAEARRPTTPDLVGPLIQAINSAAPGGPVAVLSMRTLIYPAFPAVNYAGAAWSMRHNSLWFLSGFYADQDLRAGGPLLGHSLAGMPPLERLFFDQVVEDLCANPPRLLLVERPAPVAPAGRRALDLHEYYGQSRRLQVLLEQYRRDRELATFDVLTPVSAPRCE